MIHCNRDEKGNGMLKHMCMRMCNKAAQFYKRIN
jgi:hypothetical protein